MNPFRPKPRLLHLVVAAAALLASFAVVTITGQQPAAAPEFTVTAAMVPMRDGVKLHTVVFTPKAASAPLPFLFMRTPYQAPETPRPLAAETYRELVAEGYIFVFQDIRGRFKSEGTFVMQRPPRDKRDPRAIDESTDAYDTIAWLVANVPGHNGRVGMMGISYDGWLTAMAMLDPHPALRAVSPQASPADMYLGDDFHHNGAFRLSYGFEYAAMMETTKESFAFRFDRYDTYEWYLRLGPLGAVNERILLGKIPSWNDFVAHPNYDAFWQKQAMASYLTRVTVPTLTVAGWWDQEDFYGPQKIYETLEPNDAQKMSFFVAGPWNHGGWMRADGTALGRIKFGSNTSAYYREKIQAPFFAHYLKDKDGWEVPEAITFETGTNAWQTYDAWPPRGLTEERGLYFREDGLLSFDPPPAGDAGAFDSYVSDPARPVPYRPRPVEPTYDSRGSGWRTWLVGDQRFAHLRPDVLSWETEPLEDGRHRDGRDHRPPVRLDDRHRQRLGGQAHRRLPRGLPGRADHGRLSADDRQRGFPRALPPELRAARAARARPGDGIHDRPPRRRPSLPQGPQDHGPGAEHVVPAHRPESPDLRREHLPGQGLGLPAGDPARLPLEGPAVPHPAARPRPVIGPAVGDRLVRVDVDVAEFAPALGVVVEGRPAAQPAVGRGQEGPPPALARGPLQEPARRREQGSRDPEGIGLAAAGPADAPDDVRVGEVGPDDEIASRRRGRALRAPLR